MLSSQSACAAHAIFVPCEYGLAIFKICHSVEFNIIVRATMPMNPYDDLTVSMRRQHGKGDLDIVRASLTHRKANVSEA